MGGLLRIHDRVIHGDLTTMNAVLQYREIPAKFCPIAVSGRLPDL